MTHDMRYMIHDTRHRTHDSYEVKDTGHMT